MGENGNETQGLLAGRWGGEKEQRWRVWKETHKNNKLTRRKHTGNPGEGRERER